MKRSPAGIKQDERGQYYMVAPNGAHVLCNAPAQIRLRPRFKTLFDPYGQDYIGGFVSKDADQRAWLERFDPGTGEWKRI
jgi:hypothetical protein